MKKLFALMGLALGSVAAHAECYLSCDFSGFNVEGYVFKLPGGSGAYHPSVFSDVGVVVSDIDWTCGDGGCALSPDARLSVELRVADGDGVALKLAAPDPLQYFLSIETVYPQLSVQDPLGASWNLVANLADWHYGIHVSDNLVPEGAVFVSTAGRLKSGIGANYETTIVDQIGWIEASPSLSTSMPWVDSNGNSFTSFTVVNDIVAPVYALTSLNPSCVSADCMRYERGTLVIDAHRMSFGVQAVAAPVPEPATWASMGLGLLALGALARRRRRAH